MNINKINQSFIEKMDTHENFFKVMLEMEIKHGYEFIYNFLITSPSIKKQYLDYGKKDNNIFKDIFNVVFHHSLNRVITYEEYLKLVIKAYEDYKKNGSWREQKSIVKCLIKASDPERGKNKRKRFSYMKG